MLPLYHRLPRGGTSGAGRRRNATSAGAQTVPAAPAAAWLTYARAPRLPVGPNLVPASPSAVATSPTTTRTSAPLV